MVWTNLVGISSSVDIHVDVNAESLMAADGSEARPYSSLAQAKQYIISKQASMKLPHRVLIHPGVYYESLAIDHEALSGTKWMGIASNHKATVISGGVPIPIERFHPWDGHPRGWVANVTGLADGDFGQMISGNEVARTRRHLGTRVHTHTHLCVVLKYLY